MLLALFFFLLVSAETLVKFASDRRIDSHENQNKDKLIER